MSTSTEPALRSYLLTWGALLLLLAITVASAYVEMRGLNVAVNLVIAVLKALLVMAFFMHLREGDTVFRLAAAAGFLWLGFALLLSLSDYLTRHVIPGTG